MTTPTNWRALCAELVDIATAHCNPDDFAVGYCAAVLTSARAALTQPEPERLTVQEISNLPEHGENYIAECWGGEILQLDGGFSRADLQQLADSIPNTHD